MKSVYQIVLFKVLYFAIFHFHYISDCQLFECFALQNKPCSCRRGPSCASNFLSTIQLKTPIANLLFTDTISFYVFSFCNDFEKKKIFSNRGNVINPLRVSLLRGLLINSDEFR